MAELLRQRVNLGPSGRLLQTTPITLDPQTAVLTLRLDFPTTARSVIWDSNARVRLALIAVVDGEQYRVDDIDEAGGTIRIVEGHGVRADIERDEIAMGYLLPWGFFGRRTGFPTRLGEGKNTFTVLVEIECLRGSIDTTMRLESTIEAAPAVTFRSSAAFESASAVASAVTSDTMSVTHTGTGTNKAAFIGGWSDRTGAGQADSHTATYAGNAATEIWDTAAEFDQRQSGDYVLDGDITAGAQTVTATTRH